MARNSRDAYGFGLGGASPALAPTPIISIRAPVAGDIGLEVGTTWINTVTAQAWTMTQAAAGAATWSLSSPGASDVDTLTGDGGGAISPLAGNITVAGGTNITTAGAVNTITYNLDPAITLATSVTSPLYTAGGGIDVAIDAPAGQDIIFTMGDNAAANNVSFNDLAGNPVFTVDSNGVLSNILGITIVGALTQTAGIVSLGADAAANAVDIGTGAAAKVVTIGSVTGAASLDLLAGTGNFTLEGDVATTYAISNVGVNTGQVDIAGGTGARAINIGAGGTGAKTIGIGAAASADVITIGDATGAGSLDMVCGTGNFSLEGNVATTYAISGAGVNTGLITIGGGTGAQGLDMMNVAGVKTVNMANGVDGNTVSILNGINTGVQVLNLASGANAANSTVNVLGGIATAGVQTLNLATGASASLVNIGNAIGATAIAITSGTGNIALASTGAGDITIDSDDTLLLDSDGILELNSSAGIIGIGNDADAFDINIGTGAAARVVTIGNVTGASQVVLNSGTAGVNINTTGAGDVTIDSDDTFLVDSDGVLELNSSGAAINIGNDADAFAINIGTGASVREVTIGEATGASGVTIVSGTGNIDLNGTCENVLSKFVTRTGDDITFEASPIVQSSANTGAAPTGATGDVNILSFQEGMIMESFVLGAGQTIIAPRKDANGLIISGDLTATEGYEYNYGGALDNSRHTFTIGTDPAFFMLCTFRIADISGVENMLMGFKRSGAANNANFALYTDFATIGVSDAIAPGDCVIQTQLNTGGVVTTDTNDAWGDNTNHEIGVYVSAAGVVTYTVDGIAPTVTAALTLDATDVVCPFFRHIFNAVAPGLIHIIDLQIGYQ